MHVIRLHTTAFDYHIICCTDLPDQFTQPQANLSFENFFAVFCYPDQMVFDVINGMGRFAIAHSSFYQIPV